MATTTYTSLQTDSLLSVTLDFSVLKENFTNINEFIKSFSQFQKSNFPPLFRVHWTWEVSETTQR